MIIYIFILGIMFGSFYYVVGTRLPNNESLLFPGSHCEYCQHKLNAIDLIPLLSFIFLKGKCRYCQKKLSINYIIYELLTGILFTISYLKFNISYEFFISLCLSSLLVLIFITDFKYMIILDSPLIIFSIIIFILKVYYFNINEALFSVLDGLYMFMTMYLIGKLGTILFKKESLGGGDIKFSFVMGLVLNYRYSMYSLVLSTFLAFPYAIASMYFNKEHEVPYGPFLISSTFIIYYFFDKFKYLSYFI